MTDEVNIAKWDLRHLTIAEQVSDWSKDPRTKVGALIVSPDRRRVAWGYNGFPRKILDSLERYVDRDLKNKLVVHAEQNALDNATFDVSGCTLYTTIFPCTRCCVSIINNGIKRVVSYNVMRKDLGADLSYELFEEAGIEVVLFSTEYSSEFLSFMRDL